MSISLNSSRIQTAITWCLAWGENIEPQQPKKVQQWRDALSKGQQPADAEWEQVVAQVRALSELCVEGNRPSRAEIVNFASQQSVGSVGLIFGGVTKVKSYVFESADLQAVRGASALLDRINLIDIPALFHADKTTHFEDCSQHKLCRQAPQYCDLVRKEISDWLAKTNRPEKSHFLEALIPESIIYATGGKILAFCPVAYTSVVADAIEQRYAHQTLTANACAVGQAFSALEIYLGLLKENIEESLWLEDIDKNNSVLQAYFNIGTNATAKDIATAYANRKNFSELVNQLSYQFEQRRSGNADSGRCSRRYPPMFETHPFMQRDDSDLRMAVTQIPATVLPDNPKLSESTARKRRTGQVTKRENDSDQWWRGSEFEARWTPNPIQDELVLESWVSKFEYFLSERSQIKKYDPNGKIFDSQNRVKDAYKREARSLNEIGTSSDGYVGYIYADGNSMGRYIREQIKTPADYQQFSQDVFEATQNSVYCAIADNLSPYHYQPDSKSSRQPDKAKRDKVWIHPFEIITIGGDDVLIVVPANKAVAVAKSIGEHFERLLKDSYPIEQPKSIDTQQKAHRYCSSAAPPSECSLSTSSGVLITAANTPIYYADKLVSQLLKSAKQHLKNLKGYGYYSGTVDLLVLKAVTMISSDISAFRKEGLIVSSPKRSYKLKLYGAPYTLHELNGLIKTVEALKKASFPKSQLYQLRTLLSRGKRTAILNYLYFRSRLGKDNQRLLKAAFEEAWCRARTNDGNLAPWITTKESEPAGRGTTYETIWRDLVELEPFIEVDDSDTLTGNRQVQSSAQSEENLA